MKTNEAFVAIRNDAETRTQDTTTTESPKLVLAEKIENSEVFVIPKCGHMILLEEADQALAILKKFITHNHPSQKTA